MAFTDTFQALPDQFLDALGVAQQLILSNTAAAVESAKTLVPLAPVLPFADRLPNPVKVTDRAFSYAGKVLASQQDFTAKLFQTLLPAAPAKTATPAQVAAVK